ncbi:hypothetical protein L596_011721 [Steinernema carpocapsae]|uniref:Uncharacterized protein n=1 Tax=Steinernema carpocapsae TaxID=34508 RepID=A0A4U5NVR2_STECR|nr:hypothetical protein L596_011721 [Steinernema carpocapsae]
MIKVISAIEKLEGELYETITHMNNLNEQRRAVDMMPPWSSLVKNNPEWKPLLVAKMDLQISESIDELKGYLDELEQDTAKLRCFSEFENNFSYTFQHDLLLFLDNLKEVHAGYVKALNSGKMLNFALKQISLFDSNPTVRSTIQRLKADLKLAL